MSSITDDWNRETARMGSPRLQRGLLTTALQLDPLASLVGSWRGPGFNAIWRPDNDQPRPTASSTASWSSTARLTRPTSR
jgi:hypothetical protein